MANTQFHTSLPPTSPPPFPPKKKKNRVKIWM